MTGSTTVAEGVWFDYGHTTNPGFSSSTPNITKAAAGTFTVLRCNEPTFLPGETYKFRAHGSISGVGATKTYTMPVLVPHALETLSMYGEDFMAHGEDPLYLAVNIWTVYSLAWGSYFLLILIAFIFMNVTIKQKSIALSFLLMLISGGALFAIGGMPEQFTQIAEILMAVALAGLAYWLYKRR